MDAHGLGDLGECELAEVVEAEKSRRLLPDRLAGIDGAVRGEFLQAISQMHGEALGGIVRAPIIAERGHHHGAAMHPQAKC
jgi:hypothetical protein